MTYAEYNFDIVAISAPYVFRTRGTQLPAVGLSQINSNFVDQWKADGTLTQRIEREIGFVMGTYEHHITKHHHLISSYRHWKYVGAQRTGKGLRICW